MIRVGERRRGSSNRKRRFNLKARRYECSAKASSTTATKLAEAHGGDPLPLHPFHVVHDKAGS